MENTKQYIGAGLDNNGKVFIYQNNVYRELLNDSSKVYSELLRNEPLKNALFERGLVETEFTELEEETVLRHEKINFISFNIEWSFEMLKDAALLTIDLTRLLVKSGYDLKDAHPYNILFKYNKPIFCDFSSIIRAEGKRHRGWEDSFFAEFYLSLFFYSKNFKALNKKWFYGENTPTKKYHLAKRFKPLFYSYNSIFRNSKDRLNALDNLYSFITKISIKEKQTRWRNYLQIDEIDVDDKKTWTPKELSAHEFLQSIYQNGNSVLDIASNAGRFSFIASRIGYEVVAFDYEDFVIDDLYNKLKKRPQKIYPFVMDFTDMTKTHGLNNMWKSAIERFACDVTLSMAVLHHLCLCQGVSFNEFAERISGLTKNYAIVEYIDRDDVHVQKWLDGKDWYTETNFIKSMSKYFILIKEASSNLETRKVFLFKKKSKE